MALPNAQQPALMPVEGGLDTTEVILDRRKEHTNDDWRNVVYALRLLAADQLNSDGSFAKGARKDGKFPDLIKKTWEEGRHNTIRINTQLQVKSLVFNKPDLKWTNCKVTNPEDAEWVSKIRKALYLKWWDDFGMSDIYRSKLSDMIIAGEANVAFWNLPDGLQPEYIDLLDITWDPAFKEPHKRRWVLIDRPMPKVEAVKQFPAIAKKINAPEAGKAGGEATCTVTLYYSNTTYAVLYGKEFVLPPQANPYGRIPVRCTELFRELSVKHSTGMAELQVGTFREMLALQRHFRETVKRSTAVGVLKGNWGKDAKDALMSGEEGTVISTETTSATYEVVSGEGIEPSALERYQQLEQDANAQSGTNDFQRGQTDTKVDFASQLAFIAQQSGALGKHTEQQHEDGIRLDAEMMMEIGAVPGVYTDPVNVVIDGNEVQFDQLTPIAPILGDDGEIILTPGGMTYKSPAQKIQEQMIVAQALELCVTLPPGIAEHMMLSILKAAEIDNAEQIIQDMVQQRQAAMMQQAAMQATAQQGNSGQSPSGPVGRSTPSPTASQQQPAFP